MSATKHLAGFVLFTFIVAVAVLLNNLFGFPNPTLAQTIHPLPFLAREETSPFEDYKVRLVSLDFINKRSYTIINLQKPAGGSVPQSLWVTTQFFSPQYPGRVWVSTSRIAQPFLRSDRVEFVASADCEFCQAPDTPRSGYFARVSVTENGPDTSTEISIDQDITTAQLVVVQAERNYAQPVLR